MQTRLQLLQQLLAQSPGDTFTLFAIAKEHENAGNNGEALAYYLRLRETDPAYVGLYYHLGKLYEKMSLPQDAANTYREGMRAARDAGDLHALSELNGARMDMDDSDDDM